MNQKALIGAIDQGTSSSRFLVSLQHVANNNKIRPLKNFAKITFQRYFLLKIMS
jgi:hypothetical protein